MTAIARVEEYLATFMKKVVYYEKFFQRMGSNLPVCVTDTANLLFQRCYEYRDEIRDELESSVAYVADAGRWVVGMGDWNSKMEKRLNQTLAATVTLKNAPMNRKAGGAVSTSDVKPPIARKRLTKAAKFSSEMSALGMEISGALSEILGSNNCNMSAASTSIKQTSTSQGFDTDNEAMNPFADSYRDSNDTCAKGVSSAGASVTSSAQSLSDTTLADMDALPRYPHSDKDITEGPLSPVSMGEYECLEIDSIPKYAAFKSSAQLAARRQYAPGSENGSHAVSATYNGRQSTNSASITEYNELFPSPPLSAQTVSSYLESPDTHASLKKTLYAKPMLDINYLYDSHCEMAHNPFVLPNTSGSCGYDSSVISPTKSPSLRQQRAQPNNGLLNTTRASSPLSTSACASSAALDRTQTFVPLSAALLDPFAAGTEVGVASSLPTPYKAINFPQAGARTALTSGPAFCAQSSSLDGAQGYQKYSACNVDSIEAGVTATKITTADDAYHDSDYEHDLFGVSKKA
ncbi:unnamed protein product [Peronospora belbahrii]|uniref:Uncharacterized protein n=1 Tax=Peronospora belbahrii TaxID=622444 RepID=A0AAU9L1H1_9STRA|nr:unnamed protein product [Peronospora belbahrii]CAH0513639.1 unnamed protein product [Peronospora belbahrii]